MLGRAKKERRGAEGILEEVAHARGQEVKKVKKGKKKTADHTTRAFRVEGGHPQKKRKISPRGVPREKRSGCTSQSAKGLRKEK